MDRREYVCNQMYKQHDLLRKGSWTDADKLEYMELNIAPYSRYWRMGMKKALKHAIRLLREEEAKADRKTENSSEKPNNCTDCECTDDCTECREAEHGCEDEPTISKMEQVDKDINVRSKDEPQTERLWCATCKYNEWDNMNPKCDECIVGEDKPSNYEPQTDCPWK